MTPSPPTAISSPAKGFRLPEGDAATAIDEELRAAPATHLANLKMRALFRIGQILASQKKHEEAIATWQSYVKDYPNGPEWSESQNAIINAEFQMGLDALTGKQEELAMQRFDAFLRAHPLDERAPRILYLFGAVHEAKALELEDAKGAEGRHRRQLSQGHRGMGQAGQQVSRKRRSPRRHAQERHPSSRTNSASSKRPSNSIRNSPPNAATARPQPPSPA